ncbi:MAG: hypothetical protein ACJ8G2_06935 [Burkholderiales bacterium]
MKWCLICLSTLLSLLSSCATTDLTNNWKNPEYSGEPASKVLVVGIADHAGVRRVFEDTLAQALTKRGVQAVASYSMIPTRGKISEEELVKAVERTGANGVLITRLVRRETETIQATESMGMAPAAYGMRTRYYGYYDAAWSGHYEPAMTQTIEYVIAETALFRPEVQQPVWSGTTRSQRMGDVRKATEDFAEVMIDAMKKDSVI